MSFKNISEARVSYLIVKNFIYACIPKASRVPEDKCIDQPSCWSRKRKLVDQDLGEMIEKRNALQDSIGGLLAEADVLGRRAEEKHDWLDLSKANAFRVSAREKEEELYSIRKI